MRRTSAPGVIAATALAILLATTASCADTGKGNDAAFGARVRSYLLAHPEVIQEAIEALQAKQHAEAEVNARKSIGEHRHDLVAHKGDPTLGTGPVTVVEFFDYRCGYCKAAAPRVPAMVSENKSIRLVFKEFPILSPISEVAARAALAADRQGKYMPVHLGFMAEKALDEAAIDRVMKDKGVDLDRAHADMKSADIEKQIADNKALAREIGVDGTPGFVVGDKMIGGFIESDILAAVKASANAAVDEKRISQ